MYNKINILVVYALPNIQYLLNILLSENSTVKDAIFHSEILSFTKNINININTLKVGIFNKHVSLHTLLKEGDRIEIYRSVLLTPIEWRKQKINKK